MRAFLVTAVFLLASGCVEVAGGGQASVAPPTVNRADLAEFRQVVARVAPVAERVCRTRAPGRNCNFQIVIDQRPGQPANAYQTLDKNGRPVLAFNLALIAETRNSDELAFVMGHEAAHHILGHLAKTQTTAATGSILGGLLAVLAGADPSGVDVAQNLGGTVGARVYSKNFELEADRLGTIIAFRAGYDPVRGAAYFTRIPDPGNSFLGTHPPNRQRIKTVRQTMKTLQ